MHSYSYPSFDALLVWVGVGVCSRGRQGAEEVQKEGARELEDSEARVPGGKVSEPLRPTDDTPRGTLGHSHWPIQSCFFCSALLRPPPLRLRYR